jgi:hypothetical protein
MNFYTIITTIVNIITAVTTISVVGFIMGDVSHVVVLLPFSVIIIFYHHYQIVICYLLHLEAHAAAFVLSDSCGL